MDEYLTWGLAAVAVAAWIAALVLDTYGHGTEFAGSGRLAVYTLVAVSCGTFIVSTLVVTDVRGPVVVFVAFNRAMLAGAGIVVAGRAWHRWSARRRGR